MRPTNPVSMWRKLNNWWQSIRAYPEMSPDLKLRRKINKTLRQRSAYGLHDWHKVFWEPIGIPREIATFVYLKLEAYSGLDSARLRPGDRLIDDLKLPLVCWYDWELNLCEEFYEQFGVDLMFSFDLNSLTTLKDLLLFLNQKALVS